MFFKYDATTAKSYHNYTGSIHVGVDTVAGDYYLQNSSNTVGDLKYGIRTDESQPFSIIPYTDNQIIQVKNGQHLILYQSNFSPVQTVDEISSDRQRSQTDNSQAVNPELDVATEGMIKLSMASYNNPVVLAPQTENAYYELYDEQLNVLVHEQLDSETLLSLSPNQASYIKFSGTKISQLSEYTTTGRLKGAYFSPAVYVVGTNLEPRSFELVPTSDTCRYRVLDDSSEAVKAAYNDCSSLPILLDLTEGQIVEVHGANLTKYDGAIEAAS